MIIELEKLYSMWNKIDSQMVDNVTNRYHAADVYMLDVLDSNKPEAIRSLLLIRPKKDGSSD